MRINNLSESVLSLGWMPSRLPVGTPLRMVPQTTTFFLKGTFRLHPGKSAAPREGEAPLVVSGDTPIRGDRKHGLGYSSDFVPCKPRGEFTAVGTAHPPPGGNKHFLVTMRVGDRSRSIGVVGDRAWKRGHAGDVPGEITTPAKVTSISYDNAWGGLDYPRNPLGRGREGERLHNLVLPERLVMHRLDEVAPAVFAPIPPDAPLRKARLGTYDQEWLKERWPWFPRDFDTSYFNSAPENQWMKGYLRGDEKLEFENMHPEVPLYRSALPGLRARCFLSRITNWRVGLKPEEEVRQFSEVPLNLDTLWVDMDEELLVLVWRGHAEVSSIKLRDVDDVMVATESLLDQRREIDFYRQQLEQTIHFKIPAALASPAPAPAPTPELESTPVSASTPTPATPQDPPFSDDVMALLRDAEKELTATFDSMKPLMEDVVAHNEALLSDPTALKTALDSGFTLLSSVKQPIDQSQTQASSDFDEIKEGLFRMLTQPEPPPVPNVPVADKVPAPDEKEIPILNPAEKDWRGMDLRGRDFSGLDLEGADFMGSLLSGAKFRQSNLRGADFTAANLTGADISGADLSQSKLDGCDLSGCAVADTKWVGASLVGTNFRKMNLERADFSSCSGLGICFYGCNLKGAKFVEVDFLAADFSASVLEQANFNGAKLPHADFSGARAPRITMDGAQMENFRGNRGADFSFGSFRRISAKESLWENSNLQGADFLQADMPESRFCEANMKGAHLDRAILVKSVFEDTLLNHAVLTHANLHQCAFDRADLSHANFDGSNLYESGFWNTRFQQTSWKHANLRMTRFDPSLHP
jgi:uncharacterized protein YjbI with pentapeptide repeats